MTIDDVKKECLDQSAIPVDDPFAPTGDLARPFWVVVVNPVRQPPVPKFHSGHVSQESANNTAALKQKAADKKAESDSAIRGVPVKPFRFFAVDAPKPGNCPSCGVQVDAVRTYTGAICQDCEDKAKKGGAN